jgi:chemotaxis signal transduction protein
MTTLVRFRSGDRAYAIPVERVREVRTREGMMDLPSAQADVAGLLQDADDALTVMTALGSTADDENVLVVTSADRAFGLLVDEVAGVVTLNGEIGAPPAGQDNGIISGVFSAGEELVLLVDVDALGKRIAL